MFGDVFRANWKECSRADVKRDECVWDFGQNLRRKMETRSGRGKRTRFLGKDRLVTRIIGGVAGARDVRWQWHRAACVKIKTAIKRNDAFPLRCDLFHT